MSKEILEYKYGKAMVRNLLSDGRINLDKEAPKGSQQQIVIDQMKKMIDLGLLTKEDYDQGEPWAFDVSSTYADLDANPKISIMIIGEDPHVAENDYQAVYGFAQKGVTFEKAEITDKFKKFLIKLFYSEEEVSKMKNGELQKFLSKFYVTDLCHFTPQGKNNRKKDVKRWPEIKVETARHFLKKEIEIIKPDYIITHGGASRKFLAKIWGIKIKADRIIGNKVFIGEYNNIKIIGITHLGSGFTTGHWYKNIDATREEFIKKEIKF